MVALETALLVLIARNEYVEIARIVQSGSKRIESKAAVDQTPFERRNELVRQSVPGFENDDSFDRPSS